MRGDGLNGERLLSGWLRSEWQRDIRYLEVGQRFVVYLLSWGRPWGCPLKERYARESSRPHGRVEPSFIDAGRQQDAPIGNYAGGLQTSGAAPSGGEVLLLPRREAAAVRAAAGQAAERAPRGRLRPSHHRRQERGEQADLKAGEWGRGLQMPPTGALSPEEIGILRAWIDQGAEFADVEIKEEAPKPVDPKLAELISAVRAQNQRAAQEMLRANPELVKGQDAGGSTLLHHAAGFGTTATMKMLLEKGADVNARNRTGSTPLIWATGDVEKMRFLLKHGAAVDAQTTDGRASLYLAASQHDSDAAVRLLLDSGANPNLGTLVGRTPLMAAAGSGEAGAMRLLLDKGAKVSLASGSGSTALLDAAGSRNLEAVRLLLDKGADVNAHTKRNDDRSEPWPPHRAPRTSPRCCSIGRQSQHPGRTRLFAADVCGVFGKDARGDRPDAARQGRRYQDDGRRRDGAKPGGEARGQ